MSYRPEEDGITHINVYSKGKTTLGKLLSNFAHTPFILDGWVFQSVEGWWYWRLTGDPYLMELWGITAKTRGKDLLKEKSIREYISEDELRAVYKAKLEAHPDIHKMLKENELPLAHYYVFGGKVIEPKLWQWTAQLWNEFK